MHGPGRDSGILQLPVVYYYSTVIKTATETGCFVTEVELGRYNHFFDNLRYQNCVRDTRYSIRASVDVYKGHKLKLLITKKKVAIWKLNQ